MDSETFVELSKKLSDDVIIEQILSFHIQDAEQITDENFDAVFSTMAMSKELMENRHSFGRPGIPEDQVQRMVRQTSLFMLGYASFALARNRAFEAHLRNISDGPLTYVRDYFGQLNKGVIGSEQPAGTYIRNAIAHGDVAYDSHSDQVIFRTSVSQIALKSRFFYEDLCPEIFRYYALLFRVRGSNRLTQALIKKSNLE